jgi:Cu/Ag efflux protein CusF
MRSALLIITFAALAIGMSCSKPDAKPANTAPANTATSPKPAPSAPRDGNYNGKGTVTKINLTIGSVEVNHENIEGLMPAMQMEFYVTDKALLNGLKIGDKIDFVVEYKGGTEKINSIKKDK